MPSGARASAPPDARPLTVGYVLKMFPRFSETFIANEIFELESRGLRVVIFSMKPPNENLRQSIAEAIKAERFVIPPLRGRHLVRHARFHLRCMASHPGRYARTLSFTAKRGTRAAWRKFLVAPYIVCQARASGVEHFHAHFASGPARQAKLASLLSGTPFSFTAHAKDLFWTGHQHGENNKLKKRLRCAAFVVTISEYNRNFITHLGFKVPRRRIVTIYNGLDLGRWRFIRPDGLPTNGKGANEAPLILSVGRLVPKKGFNVLVEACRLLRAEGLGFQCAIAGEGPELDSLRDQVARLGLSDEITLLGAVPQTELAKKLYPRATLLVQPSVIAGDGDQDGIPTVILEALALGVPVVATPVSGIGEAVINEETGLLVPPDDVFALASAIRRVIADPALAGTVARGGRAVIEQRFNMKQNAKVLISLFEYAARGKARWSILKMRERVGMEASSDLLQDEAQESSDGMARHGDV